MVGHSRSTSNRGPAGLYRVEVIPGHIASGEFVEVDPPSRLVYTWGWEGEGIRAPGSSTIEFTLEQSGDGTKLTSCTAGSRPRSPARRMGTAGTTTCRGSRCAAEGGDPGRDPFLTP